MWGQVFMECVLLCMRQARFSDRQQLTASGIEDTSCWPASDEEAAYKLCESARHAAERWRCETGREVRSCLPDCKCSVPCFCAYEHQLLRCKSVRSTLSPWRCGVKSPARPPPGLALSPSTECSACMKLAWWLSVPSVADCAMSWLTELTTSLPVPASAWGATQRPLLRPDCNPSERLHGLRGT